MQTVRDATFDALRRRGLLTLFANPGSTEVSLLVDLPDDLRFVLALHESSVIGIATSYAIAGGRPALAVLHTTAGLGNAVGALATARVNRAPLVVLVGQQDRRHLASEPFLAGRLSALKNMTEVTAKESLRKQGVDISKVKLTEVDFPEMAGAVEGGRVDAAFAIEPFVTTAREAGQRVIDRPYSNTKRGLQVGCYFASDQFIAKNGDALERFRAGVADTAKLLTRDPRRSGSSCRAPRRSLRPQRRRWPCRLSIRGVTPVLRTSSLC